MASAGDRVTVSLMPAREAMSQAAPCSDQEEDKGPRDWQDTQTSHCLEPA